MERLVHYIFGLVFAAGGLLALPGDGQANEASASGLPARTSSSRVPDHSE